MSDKLLHNRLDSLFADLDDFGELPSPDVEGKEAGWTFSCDADGQYTECSNEVSEVLGIPPDDMLGKPMARYALTADSADQFETTLNNGQGPFELRLNFRDSNGEVVPVLVQIQRAPSPNGAITGWEGSVQVIDQDEAEEIVPQSQALMGPAIDIPIDPTPTAEISQDLETPETKPLPLEEITPIPETPAASDEHPPTTAQLEEDLETESSGEPVADLPYLMDGRDDQPSAEEAIEAPPEAFHSTFDTLIEDDKEIEDISTVADLEMEPSSELAEEFSGWDKRPYRRFSGNQ